MEKQKHDPMKDNPEFARANREHRFGAEGGNPRYDPSKAVTVRHFMRKLSEMSAKEVAEYIENEDNPLFRRRLAIEFTKKGIKPKDLCEFVNQIEGMPTQPISTEEPPVINISLNGNQPNE